MFKNYPRVLFFISDVTPSLEQQLAAERLAPCRVSFRNALLTSTDGALEDCEGVFGDVPARYAAKYPSAEKAIETYVAEREAAFAAKEAETARNLEVMHATMTAAADNDAAVAKRKADEAAAEAKKKADIAAEAKAKANAATKDAKTVAATDPEKVGGEVTKAAETTANAWKPNA